MERQCSVEIMKVPSGFVVVRPRDPMDGGNSFGNGYYFHTFSELWDWLYKHFRDEGEPEIDRSKPCCKKTLSERMRIREQQADITNGEDSPFITMDRRVWLDYADEVEQLERAFKTL